MVQQLCELGTFLEAFSKTSVLTKKQPLRNDVLPNDRSTEADAVYIDAASSAVQRLLAIERRAGEVTDHGLRKRLATVLVAVEREIGGLTQVSTTKRRCCPEPRADLVASRYALDFARAAEHGKALVEIAEEIAAAARLVPHADGVDGVYLWWHGQESQELTGQEQAILRVVGNQRQPRVTKLMHDGGGAVWAERYVGSLQQRRKIKVALSALCKKLPGGYRLELGSKSDDILIRHDRGRQPEISEIQWFHRGAATRQRTAANGELR